MEGREFEFKGMVINGFVMIAVILLLTVAFVFSFFMDEELGAAAYVIGIVGIVLTFFCGRELSSWSRTKPVPWSFSVPIRGRSGGPGFSGSIRS